MTVRVLRRRGSAWTSKNPVLRVEDIGVDTTGTPRIKIGDGVTHWNDLPWLTAGEQSSTPQSRLFMTGLVVIGNTTTGGDIPNMHSMLVEVLDGDLTLQGTVVTPPFPVSAGAKFSFVVIPTNYTSGTLRVNYAELMIMNSDRTQYIDVGCGNGMDLPEDQSATSVIWSDHENPSVGSDLTLDEDSMHITTTAGGLFTVAATLSTEGHNLVI